MMLTRKLLLALTMLALQGESFLLPTTTRPSQELVRSNRITIITQVVQSSEVRGDEENAGSNTKPAGLPSLLSSWWDTFLQDLANKRPPLQVEDNSVLLYDVILLVNLSASISFWVTHRMDFAYIGSAISEGSLLSILWIIAGLYHGAFLYSAVDGHHVDDKGGPSAAGLLGLQTFIGTVNLRIVVALITAVVEHRKVGTVVGEDLIPLELLFGLVLMSCWRALHSSYTPRI